MFKHILLPLDGSQLAESALPVVAYLADKLKAQVTLLHIIEKNAPASIHGQRHLTNEDEACQYLQNIAEKAFPPHLEVYRHVHTEEVSKVSQSIVQHSDELDPDLIVMCAHGEGGLRDFVVGSIAQQVIASGTIPVLLLQPEKDAAEFSSFERILVALDGNPEHEAGYALTTELAAELGAAVHLIQVVPTLSTLNARHSATGTLLPTTTAALLEIDEDNAREYLEEKITGLLKAGVNVSAEVERGDPARQVVQSADTQNSQLIVLGTHGKSGMKAFWAGSVAPRIVEQTHRPILLVPVER
ncbi:MAG: universal stress protein [Anaerolineaceae bacterium]|nr:universal stress protein [Anaerolineaceae bacterium]